MGIFPLLPADFGFELLLLKGKQNQINLLLFQQKHSYLTDKKPNGLWTSRSLPSSDNYKFFSGNLIFYSFERLIEQEG